MIECSKQARAFGQSRKQGSVISAQPAIEGACAHAFEREQQRQGDDFAGMQLGLWVLADIGQGIGHSAKQFSDKIFGSHGSDLFLRLRFDTPRWPDVRDFSNSHHWLYRSYATNPLIPQQAQM